MNSCCVLAVKAVSTHMFEGVMGHRHGSSLLQVVIPAEVTHILSWVSIWNTQHISLSRPAFQNILSSWFHAAVHRVVLTRLQWLLTHAGAPSRPRLGALRRNRGGGSLSSESKWMSVGPKHRNASVYPSRLPHSHLQHTTLCLCVIKSPSADLNITQQSLNSILFSTRLMRQVTLQPAQQFTGQTKSPKSYTKS